MTERQTITPTGERKLTVTCTCGEHIEVSAKEAGKLIGSLRKKKNTPEFMREIARRPRKRKPAEEG